MDIQKKKIIIWIYKKIIIIWIYKSLPGKDKEHQ
jgi:hypothetical protein